MTLLKIASWSTQVRSGTHQERSHHKKHYNLRINLWYLHTSCFILSIIQGHPHNMLYTEWCHTLSRLRLATPQVRECYFWPLNQTTGTTSTFAPAGVEKNQSKTEPEIRILKSENWNMKACGSRRHLDPHVINRKQNSEIWNLKYESVWV